jgi:SAM-dependent methyltransferase
VTESSERQRLRSTFEEVAELYDRMRPMYPAELFDELVRLASVPERGRIVEIGSGTGKATRPLAERGYRITAVELGAQLAAVARRNLAPFPDAEIVNADFETWTPETAEFDLVAAFTAFHWIDPGRRYDKASSLLRPGGALAVVATDHVLPADGDPFFVEVQEDYVAVTDQAEPSPSPPPDLIPDLGAELAASGLFRSVGVSRHLWEVTYTADEYVSLLDTYSANRALEPEARRELYERIRMRIARRPGAAVRKTYLATLNVAERR